MSAHPFSEKFVNEMIYGWLDGLQMKYEDSLRTCRANIKIWRKNSKEAGDIDALVQFDEAVRLNSLFPPGHFTIRPNSIKQSNPRVSCLFGEFKRSLSSTTHLLGKVQQFIRFYSELFGQTGLSLPQNIKKSIDECTHLLFVFNGIDAADAETAFNNLGIRQIDGRPIVLVWANSTEISTWGSQLRTKRLLEEKDMVIAEKDKMIEQLQAQIGNSSKKRSSEEMEYSTSSHTPKGTKKAKK